MGARRTVLVVEDDDDLRAMYGFALRTDGFLVREAGDGLDALRILDEDPPDAIVLDLGLPIVSGHVVRQEIAAHAHTRSIPVVVVTAADVTMESLDVACLLRKPVWPDRLIEAVRRCLAAGGGQSSIL